MVFNPKVSYQRDYIYFCTSCRRFHSMATNEIVDVPGVNEYYNSDNGKTYKVRKSRPKSRPSTNGFG